MELAVTCHAVPCIHLPVQHSRDTFRVRRHDFHNRSHSTFASSRLCVILEKCCFLNELALESQSGDWWTLSLYYPT